MLFDVGESVRELIRAHGGVPANVEILFDAPTKDWSARRSGPAIDVFLYDIRENIERRHAVLEDVRDGDVVTGRRSPTRWFNCSYLVTAWTQRPEDEHRLLGGILSGLVTIHTLPAACLKGALAATEREVFLTMCRPPGSERSISDIWSALGGELKPSLDLVVVVPVEPASLLTVGPPVLEAPSLFIGEGIASGGGSAATRKRADGKRTDDASRKPGYRRAKIDSDADLVRGGVQEREPVAVEELVAGTEALPGRRFRFAVHEPPPGTGRTDRKR